MTPEHVIVDEVEQWAERVAANEHPCDCGVLIVDGPFRFCISCRQVDLTLPAVGGR